MSVLQENATVGKYRIQSLIKENEYTETYRVVGSDDTPYFLKLYVLKRTPERLVNIETCEVYTIERCKSLSHNNIVSFIDFGKIQPECGECHYFVTDYFTGDVLFDKIQREGKLQPDKAVEIYRGILQGLKYLHEKGLCHNDITPRNIMLSKVAGGIPEIIDMGHTSPRCNGKVPFEVSDLEVLYCANETFMGLYDEQSDIFSATAVLYAMLTGKAPWDMEFTASMNRSRRFSLLKDKRKTEPLDVACLDVDDRIMAVIKKGLALKFENRFRTVDEVMAVLDGNGNTASEDTSSPNSEKTAHHEQNLRQADDANAVDFRLAKTTGNGFSDIAGMKELKDMLSQKVIFVLKNKELAERYRLTPPNGMLLYGPPGCGKTFFAEKFAEETEFNFMMVKSSDLASIYIHGSQEKIGALFKKAEENAPAVLCFDEFDALVPNRSDIDNQSMSGEVNEFLSQLNNCSKRGIFVIATSNRPDKIDPAVLRTGRIDKQVYVPLPDKEARKEMFKLHLQGRPYDEGEVDAEKLADMSEGYVASDIAFIVNDAAMTAAFTGQDITQQLLENALRNTRPSILPETLDMYKTLEQKMQGIERRNLDRPKIGFIQ